MSNDEQFAGNLEDHLKALMEGLGDPRVVEILSGSMKHGLVAHVGSGLPEVFIKAAAAMKTAPDEEGFLGLPDEIVQSDNQAEAIFSWVHSDAGQYVQALAVAIAGLVGNFVVLNRDAVIKFMKDAGQGPVEDRQDVVASASALINSGIAIIEEIDGIEDISQAREKMDESLEKFEEARELLSQRVMDDAIMFGSNPDSGAEIPEDVPELSPQGRRTDVENLLADSWLCEVDGHMKLANKVGPAIDGSKVAREQQHDYILDALVAIQDAYTTRPQTSVLLRFGQLRLAKGDIGEARMAAEKVMELVPDEDEPICQAAISLYHDVEKASPLSRKDKRCFIATAAMDDIDAPEVDALRLFRDEVLLGSSAGRLFVRAYYRFSPHLAGLISRSAGIRGVVRRFLIVPLARAVSGGNVPVSEQAGGREN